MATKVSNASRSSKPGSSDEFLYRYTTLPVLFDALINTRLTLLSPDTWADKNDIHYIKDYGEKIKCKTVLAICFTKAPETFHHWKVFADGPSGVCIKFRKEPLIEGLEPLEGEGFRTGNVIYKAINVAKAAPPTLLQIPFCKREPY